MSSSKQTAAPSESAQALLEQYKHYRDDGIVEIKEPISSERESKPDLPQNDTNISQKIMHKNNSVASNKLPNKKKHKTISDIGGYSEQWWKNMENGENHFVDEYKHNVENIALMQKYETLKDPSPFNKDNDMDLQTNWDQHLWKESVQKQEQYLNKTQPIKKSNKKKKKRVNFSPELVTKQASSERLIDAQVSCKTKPIKETVNPMKKTKKKQQTYGNLVGFFNKKQTKNKANKSSANKDSNPYLDQTLMKDIADFTPNNNHLFEEKFDHKQNEFNSVIITSDEFKSNVTKPKESVVAPQKTQTIEHNKEDHAFNGRVFERKPPDMIYINDTNDANKTQKSSELNVKPQSLPKITRPKTSLFRKRIERNDAFYEIEETEATDTQFPKVIHVSKDENNSVLQLQKDASDTKQVRFASKLVSKQLVIDDKYQQKEDICLLFLDVDGVLNCSYSPSLSRAHVLRLKKILNQSTNCKICISSSWRIYTRTRLQLIDGMRQIANIDVKSVVIGDTPRIRKDPMICRPEEIQSYLQNDEYLNTNYNVLRWCAIDDIPLDSVNLQYRSFMKDHFVKTDPRKGITDNDIEKVLAILNGLDKTDKLHVIHEERAQNDNMQMQVIEKKERQQIKILFLDVDGVLNYTGFEDKRSDATLSYKHLQRLRQIVEKTKCKIVLSTTWRRMHLAKRQLLNQLSSECAINVSETVIGDTPVFGSQSKKSLEICKYLDDIKQSNRYDVVRWIAIDDLPLDKMGTKRSKEMFQNHFVKTNVDTGLSDNNVLCAISLLGAE